MGSVEFDPVDFDYDASIEISDFTPAQAFVMGVQAGREATILEIQGCGEHWSDCSLHNRPAMPIEPCNCGGVK